jgi:hypothetical protein
MRSLTCIAETQPVRRTAMLDLILLAVGLALFALSVGYAYACERL